MMIAFLLIINYAAAHFPIVFQFGSAMRSRRRMDFEDQLAIKTNLGMGVIIKANNDWRGVGRPQVAMHLQLPQFLVIILLLLYFLIIIIVIIMTLTHRLFS